LLNSLAAADYQRLAPDLEHVALELGSAIYEAGAPMQHVYFPTTGIISLLNAMNDGTSAEIASVGNEGVLGVPLFLGGESTTSRAVVQSAGYAYRMKATVFKEQFGRSGSLTRLLMLYTQALAAQMAQTAVCYRRHSIYQQLCCRLLLTLDRLQSNEIITTHELMANMLGVRREGITEAAGKAQHAGLVRYHRGKITVLDRAGVEAQSCECYRVVRNECDRLLPHGLQPSRPTAGNASGLTPALSAFA
jgi:CRP-like cAMP-binding protein